jgi:hypothetical protein
MENFVSHKGPEEVHNIIKLAQNFGYGSRHFWLSATVVEFLSVCFFGVAWSLSMSIGSSAQGLWLSGSVGLAVCSCSVLVPVCLP